MPRKEERYTFLKEVQLEFASGKRDARISDISPGGCYVDTIAQIPVGEPLSLTLTGLNGEILNFNGRVAYVLDGMGFGVEFTDLTDAHREFLGQVIRSAGG